MTDVDVGNQLALVFLLAAVIYIVPSVVAFSRRHPNRYAILAVNLVFGGTGIGWLGSLIWAMQIIHLQNNATCLPGGESGPHIFVNDPKAVSLVARTDARHRDQPPATTMLTTDAALVKLERLCRLRADGHVSEAEFAAMKEAIVMSIQRHG